MPPPTTTTSRMESAGAHELEERIEARLDRILLRLERDPLADERARLRRPVAEAVAAEVDRLARDEQLDRDDPLSERCHLRKPSRRERRQRRPVLDPLCVRRA